MATGSIPDQIEMDGRKVLVSLSVPSKIFGWAFVTIQPPGEDRLRLAGRVEMRDLGGRQFLQVSVDAYETIGPDNTPEWRQFYAYLTPIENVVSLLVGTQDMVAEMASNYNEWPWLS